MSEAIDGGPPVVEVTRDLVRVVIEVGGYVHPLFAAPAPAAACGVGPPLPGQALLLLAGGLAEQSGELDEARAMLELSSVKFNHLVHAGARLTLRLLPGEERRTRGGSVLREYRWELLSGADLVVMEAEVLMLMHG